MRQVAGALKESCWGRSQVEDFKTKQGHLLIYEVTTHTTAVHQDRKFMTRIPFAGNSVEPLLRIVPKEKLAHKSPSIMHNGASQGLRVAGLLAGYLRFSIGLSNANTVRRFGPIFASSPAPGYHLGAAP